MKRSLLIVAPVLAVLVAACSSDVTNPSASFTLSADDTAQAAALSASDATSEDVDVMLASDLSVNAGAYSASMASSTVGASLSLSPSFGTSTTTNTDTARVGFWAFSSACTLDAATGRFTCPDVARDGLTLSRSVAFYDASGAAMSAYNDTLTDSANFQVSVNGVRVVTYGADTISRQRSMTATGLLGHETSRTWNGTGIRDDGGYRADSTRTRSYHTTDTTTFASIVVDLPRSQHPFPISGTITRKIAGSGAVDRSGTKRTFTFSRTVTVTFNGTRYVPMTVGTLQFILDLVTGKPTRA